MLTVKDTMTLDLERTWWRHPAVKESHVREVFGESMTRYYQRLNDLLDRPEAVAYDATTVNRLRRLRAQRAARRSATTVEGITPNNAVSSQASYAQPINAQAAVVRDYLD